MFVILSLILQSCHFTRFKAALDVNWIAEDKLKILKKTPDTYFIIRGNYQTSIIT
jgi:hypothetical protein